MKRWILLAVVVALAGGGLYLRHRFRQAAELAAPDEVRELGAEEIREGMRSPDPKVRLDAFAQIDKLTVAEARSGLTDALRSPHAPTRLTALASLGPFVSDGPALEVVLEIARTDPDPDVKDRAFAALLVTGDPRALLVASEVLQSAEAPLSARVRAAAALDRMTGRNTAAELAGRYGAAAEAADLLSMEWDDWLSEHGEGLRWDEESKRFVVVE